ncbi:hypothetical protein GCM10020331_031710 [Ectobacillus funiculus]
MSFPVRKCFVKKDIEYRISHGDVKAIVSYAPYVAQFDGIAAIHSLVRFIISEVAIDGWINLTERLQTESDVLEVAPTKRDDMAFFYPIHPVRPEIQRVLCIHMAGPMLICVQVPRIGSVLEKETLYGQRQVQVGKKWIWSPFF